VAEELVYNVLVEGFNLPRRRWKKMIEEAGYELIFLCPLTFKIC